jgi:uncharacterized protein (DUF2147 family)
MKRMLIGVLLACALTQVHAKDAKADSDIFGKWRVVAALDSADVTALDDKEAGRLVGKTVKISKSSFEFDGQVCKTPTYERTSELTETYFRQQMHASTENLHLPGTVTVINARCTFLFPKAKGKLMFFWQGFFFDAARVARENGTSPH